MNLKRKSSSRSYLVFSLLKLKLYLFVIDTYDCCTDTKSFFGEVASIVEFLRARKRIGVFLKFQELIYPKQRKRRLKIFLLPIEFY